MVSAVLLPNAKACFITSAGAPAVGYKLYTYDAGTLTPRATYLDAAGVANNTNPIILDARGEAVIYWDGSYKVILKDAADVPIWTADNFSQASINSVPWVAAAGTVDAITATYVPAIAALTEGMILAFRATGANATTNPTFAPNGLTAHTIVKAGGLALLAGDIPRNLYECLVRYNLANTRWELINPVPIPTANPSFTGTISITATGKVVAVTNGAVANGGTLTIDVGTSGGSFVGSLNVANTSNADGNNHTNTSYAVQGRAATFTSAVLLTGNGSGAAAFTVTMVANGIFTITNTSGVTCSVSASFCGNTG